MNKVNNFISLAEQSFPQRQITVTDVKDRKHEVLIQEKFRKSDISKLIEDMMIKNTYCNENKITFDYTTMLWIMLIKYFTDFEFVKYKTIEEEFKNELRLYQALIDLEILGDIINSFDVKEINKITEVLKVFNENLNKAE